MPTLTAYQREHLQRIRRILQRWVDNMRYSEARRREDRERIAEIDRKLNETALPDRQGPGLKSPGNGFDSRCTANQNSKP